MKQEENVNKQQTTPKDTKGRKDTNNANPTTGTVPGITALNADQTRQEPAEQELTIDLGTPGLNVLEEKTIEEVKEPEPGEPQPEKPAVISIALDEPGEPQPEKLGEAQQEKEQQEQERQRLAQEQKDLQEKERLAQEQKEQQEKERLAQEQKELQEQERQRLAQEQERQEQEQKDRQEQEQLKLETDKVKLETDKVKVEKKKEEIKKEELVTEGVKLTQNGIIAATAMVGTAALVVGGLAFVPQLSSTMMVPFVPGFGLVDTLLISGALLIIASSMGYTIKQQEAKQTVIQLATTVVVAGVCQASIHLMPQYVASMAVSSLNVGLFAVVISVVVGIGSGALQYYCKPQDTEGKDKLDKSQLATIVTQQALITGLSSTAVIAINTFLPNMAATMLPFIIVEQVLASMLINSIGNAIVGAFHSSNADYTPIK